MRKIIVEVETDSEESIDTLKRDLETEISCCWNSFDVESMKVFEAIGTNEEAIRELENESCYECTWGCESPAKCTCPKCPLKDATQKAIEALKEQRPRGECRDRLKDAFREKCNISGYMLHLHEIERIIDGEDWL